MHKKNRIVLAIVVAAGLSGAAGTAIASDGFDHMIVTGRTTQPIGHYEFCKVHPAECRVSSADTRPMRLTRQRWDELVRVNQQVNAQVTPVTDLEYYGVEEYWTFPDRFGDCEDYALLKRRQLIKLGWPVSGLLITVVRQRNGDGHAVLTVRTDRADYVLDNLDERILAWHETEYRYLKRQAAGHSGMWEGIDDARPVLVGSVSN